ncbi:MAG: O-methyltransferase [Lachnospiraceae bacterium]|nr:O-methyltransferase [Clostridiales bacterium]MDD6292326.1 O-methyltransferase [Eubacteriales bacterium]MDY2608220.1 O-methyltransferase [Lachnospiraceae bacterium]
MIVNERIVSYIHSLERSNGEVCDEIEEFAHQTNVPIIRKEMESFLRVLIEIKKPKRILELGTAIGYSAILMANSMPEDCRITTIENYDKRIPIAKENFKRAGVEDKVELLEGDALKILQKLNVPYDFVFMDAAKAQYPVYLKEIMRLLPVGGILVADNVLQDGELVESRYAVERRNRTIHSRMREYLYEVKNMKELETTIIPIGDGITLSVRKENV